MDFSELAGRYQRLDEAGLLAPAPARDRARPLFALPREAPRPQRLLRVAQPKAAVAVANGAAAAFEPRTAVSPDTPRMLSGFAALDDNLTATPPDTHGAVGPNHVMTVLNSEVQIQDRQGRRLSRVILEDFWRAHSPVRIGFDPRVIYDARNQRWIFCTLVEPDATDNALMIAVSQTNDPTGRWNLYRIPPDVAGGWADFPTMAVNGPWVLITTNVYAVTSGRYLTGLVFAFTTQDLMQGRGRVRTFRDSIAGAPVTNQNAASGRPAAFLQVFDDNSGGEGVLRLGELRGEPGNETYVGDFLRFRVAQAWRYIAAEENLGPQLGTNSRLDLGDDRMQNCVQRGNSIWCAHTVFLPATSAPNRSAVQWLEIATDESGLYRLARFGRLDDPTGETLYAYPSIAVNKNNDVLLGYNRFSAQQFVSANFSFRAGTDPVGQFQADTLFKQGEAPQRPRTRRARWGDYSVAVVDPVDDTSFWTAQEYAGSPTSAGVSRWATWWAHVIPAAAPCEYSVSSTALTSPNAAGNLTVRVTATRPDCRWMAAPNAPWITASAGTPGTGDGTLTLALSRNTGTTERRGTVTVAGREVTVTQQAGPPAADLVVTSLTAPTTAVLGRGFPASAEVRNVGVLPVTAFRLGFFLSTRLNVTAADTFTGSSCDFPNGLAPGQAAPCAGEVRVPAILTPGTYTLAAIADFENRTVIASRDTTTRVSDSGALTLTVSPDAPAFTERSVSHGASALTAATTPVVSPGQVVVIYGNRLGPAELTTAQLVNGAFPTEIAGTSVTFDGRAAPLLYVSPLQVAVMAPFRLAGAASTRMQVIRNGLPSDGVTLAVAPAVPGLFTVNFSGTGAVTALNQDFTVNAAGNAAAPGTVIQLYGTGFGAFTAQPGDGSVIQPPLPALRETVRVEIGGRAASVLYAGPAPGLIAGVIQVNAVIPEGTPAGNASVRVFLTGDAFSRTGTTISVR